MVKLKKKVSIPYSGKVYDLQVENNPSYNVEGIVVHNSAAGSLVAYLLGITKVNPLKYNLLFERFLNKGRVTVSLPDIDSDFSSESRPYVKKYMEQRFGETQVCAVGTYTTYQLKAALTDFAKLYGVSIPTVRRLSKMINGLDDKTPEDFFRIACKSVEMKIFVNKHPELINMMFLVLGQPKAASIHACAMMIFPQEKTMFQWTPIRKQNDIMVSEWEGGELDEAGFLKEDILGIEQLSKFADILNLIKQNEGKQIDLYKDVSLDDSEVFEAFCNGFTQDLFHFGAKGLSRYVVKVQPRNINDLIACICLYRPGPMENGYHEKFLLRREGSERIEYPIGAEDILKDSFGLMTTQEHIMLMCQKLAGFSLQHADDVRKCLDEDTLFWTPEGAIKIKDLPKRIKVSTLGKDFESKYNGVSQTVYNGKRQCIQLNIQGGYTLKCTPDHKVLTEIGWLEAKDCVGHFVYKDLSRRYGSLEKSKEELYLVAALITEGFLGRRGVCSFVNKDQRELDRFKECYSIIFGRDLKSYFNKATGCTSFNLLNSDIEYLGLEFALSDSKKLPEYVFSLNKDCQEYLLAKMIDFDGYVATKKGSFLIGYSSKSVKLIDQIRVLFDCLGILTTTNSRHIKGYESKYYDIGITNIDDALRVKMALERYSYKLQTFSFKCEDFDLDSQSSQKIPFEVWQPIIKNLIDNSGYNCNELLGCNILNYGINHKILLTPNRLSKILKKCGRNKFLETLLKGNFCFKKVESIKNIGKRNVYDFTMNYKCVPQAFADGILVHNCMGKKIIDKLKAMRSEFVEGYVERYKDQGVDEEYANDLWSQMEEFGKYGFNKSHAAAYSINGYNSMWLKVHYPVEFWSVAFSRASKDEYPFYINEIIRSNNIQLKSVNINKSDVNIVVDPDDGALYWAINSVYQVGEKAQQQISEERKKNGPYFSLDEFIDRHVFKGSAVNKSVIENLIMCGAFDDLSEGPTIVEKREGLLRKYREQYSIKINEEKDEFEKAIRARSGDKSKEEWWWQLQQKKRSGFSFFNYKSLCRRYFDNLNLKNRSFCDLARNIDDFKDSYQVAVLGGYVLECEIKDSRKGRFARVLLESNYSIIKVIVYAEIFPDFEELLQDCEKTILLLDGKILYSEYDEDYVVQTVKSTKIVKLTLD